MTYQYETIHQCYNEIKALCQPGAYNLVLHKHLGDVFYAIGAKDEFEATYNAKLHFIVRPQHEFLMQMYGIEDYSVYDLDVLVKKKGFIPLIPLVYLPLVHFAHFCKKWTYQSRILGKVALHRSSDGDLSS